MTTEDALLAAVIASPDDDLPRLVYCDWLEESGDPEKLARAEFIRLALHVERLGGYYEACREYHPNAIVGCGKCDACSITMRMDQLTASNYLGITAQWKIADRWAWSYRDYEQSAPCPEAIVRRGFVHTVRCTLADWFGGPCVRCHGRGMLWANFVDGEEWLPCGCERGHAPGIGREVVRRHPVEVVRTDREPNHVRTSQGVESWNWYMGTVEDRSNLPLDVFLLMGGIEFVPLEFPTREAAHAALSAALILWAKSQNRRQDTYDLSRVNAALDQLAAAPTA